MVRISVVVPVRNEAAHIRETLRGLAGQDYPADAFEILVVDGQSDDGTPDLVADLGIPNLRLLDNPMRRSSAARNVGVRQARGEFIVIVDGHCDIADRHLLQRLEEAFRASGADSLGRPQPLRAPDGKAFQRAVGAARRSWLGHNPDSAIHSRQARWVPADNVAVAYRREVFQVVGEFDESFDACEDVEFNTRVRQAGLTCFFTPAIAVDYRPRSSLLGLMRQMSRYGRGRARLARKHPATRTLPSLVPPVGLLWLVFGAMLPTVWLASMVAYAAMLIGESLRVGRAAWWRLPPVFAAIHLGFAWGYLVGCAANLTPRPPLRSGEGEQAGFLPLSVSERGPGGEV